MGEHDRAAVQLGMTPRYLDPRCHEALYEIDVGVNEVCERLDGMTPASTESAVTASLSTAKVADVAISSDDRP